MSYATKHSTRQFTCRILVPQNKWIFLINSYDPKVHGTGEIRDQDVVRATDSKLWYEAEEWKAIYTEHWPTYGNCQRCWQSGPLTDLCPNCVHKGARFQVCMLYGAGLIQRTFDAEQFAAFFQLGHIVTQAGARFQTSEIPTFTVRWSDLTTEAAIRFHNGDFQAAERVIAETFWAGKKPEHFESEASTSDSSSPTQKEQLMYQQELNKARLTRRRARQYLQRKRKATPASAPKAPPPQPKAPPEPRPSTPPASTPVAAPSAQPAPPSPAPTPAIPQGNLFPDAKEAWKRHRDRIAAEAAASDSRQECVGGIKSPSPEGQEGSP